MTEAGEVFLEVEVWNSPVLHSSSQEEAAFASSPQVNHSSCSKDREESQVLQMSQINPNKEKQINQ